MHRGQTQIQNSACRSPQSCTFPEIFAWKRIGSDIFREEPKILRSIEKKLTKQAQTFPARDVCIEELSSSNPRLSRFFVLGNPTLPCNSQGFCTEIPRTFGRALKHDNSLALSQGWKGCGHHFLDGCHGSNRNDATRSHAHGEGSERKRLQQKKNSEIKVHPHSTAGICQQDLLH